MSQVTYEELASIESEFEDIDNEISMFRSNGSTLLADH